MKPWAEAQLARLSRRSRLAEAFRYVLPLWADLTRFLDDGRIEPGRVFDRTVGLDGVPDGYRAMNEREAIKVLIRP